MAVVSLEKQRNHGYAYFFSQNYDTMKKCLLLFTVGLTLLSCSAKKEKANGKEQTILKELAKYDSIIKYLSSKNELSSKDSFELERTKFFRENDSIEYFALKMEQEEDKFAAQYFKGSDGSMEELVTQVKERLNDPESFQHVKTIAMHSWDDESKHEVKMTYRAKNSFGALVLAEVIATVDSKGNIEKIENVK